MVAALRFIGGDEIVEPFLLMGADGDVIDMTTVTVTGGVWWGFYTPKERIPLTVGAGAGIDIENNAPALNPDNQVPHGNIRLTEAQTALIPHGQVASVRLTAVRTLDNVTMSTYLVPLERIA